MKREKNLKKLPSKKEEAKTYMRRKKHLMKLQFVRPQTM